MVLRQAFFECKRSLVSPDYKHYYCQISNIRRTLVGNIIVDHSDSCSIACQRCSNYIFILDLTPGFNRLYRDNCKTWRKTLKFWDLVPLILEIWWYMYYCESIMRLYIDLVCLEYAKLCGEGCTYWGQDKMAAIWQTFSNSLSWIKIFEFSLQFHWSLLRRVQWQ